jgi:hypothetical protein
MTQALLIVGVFNGTTEWHSANRHRLSVDEIADYVAQMALTGATGTDRAKRRGHTTTVHGRPVS